MGLLDRLKKRPADDEESIVGMLQEAGAEPAQAREIVATLATRLSPEEMRTWLSDPEKSHGIPDPDAAKRMEEAGLAAVTMNWTPVNAISSGKTQLVIDEAKRFAVG